MENYPVNEGPAVGHDEAALVRLTEASNAIERIATHTWEPETFRAAVASEVAVALRAIDLARSDLRRGNEIRSTKIAHSLLQEHLALIQYGTDGSAPQVAHIVVPLPLDSERLNEKHLSMPLSDLINRLAIAIQKEQRRYRSWLIPVPSSSGVTKDRDVFDFKTNIGQHLASAIRIFPSATIAFRRPLYDWQRKTFSLNDMIADLEATLLFSRDMLAEIGVSPVQVAIVTVACFAPAWTLARQDSLGQVNYYGPAGEDAQLALYPEDPLVIGFSDFVRDPLKQVRASRDAILKAHPVSMTSPNA